MNKDFLVAKFGGSSLADKACLERSVQVALKHKANIIVVSATYGTTNMLVEINSLLEDSPIENKEKIDDLVAQVKKKHQDFASDLGCDEKTCEAIEVILDELSTLVQGMLLLKETSEKAKDRILSIGERLSSHLFAYSMRSISGKSHYSSFDVREVMRTNGTFGKARPDISKLKELSEQKLLPLLVDGEVLVTQGFIGRTEEGFTTTLGRGGSDYSASLLAEAVDAKCIQIWTDVAGIATTDPRICSNTVLIDEISFQEASELAVFGAKILHPTTLLPAKRNNIPVFVGSSYEPEAKGTWIRHSCEHMPLVRALTKKDKQALVTITTPRMLDAHGYLSKVFEIFERLEVSVDSVTTSEISISVTIDESELSSETLMNQLKVVGEVEIETGFSSVSLIGNGINHTPGLSKAIFTTLQQSEPINVRMICLGASKHNFCFLVNSADSVRAIQQLHRSFIEEKIWLS